MTDPAGYYWAPCTGCYEPGDGTRHPEHGCHVGAGCDECGGGGIVEVACDADELDWCSHCGIGDPCTCVDGVPDEWAEARRLADDGRSV